MTERQSMAMSNCDRHVNRFMVGSNTYSPATMSQSPTTPSINKDMKRKFNDRRCFLKMLLLMMRMKINVMTKKKMLIKTKTLLRARMLINTNMLIKTNMLIMKTNILI